MRVQKLTLRNFRNVAESTYTPDPRLNFLLGANGQGKTSFLEALGFLATLRSFRGSKPAEVLKWGAVESEVQAVLVPEADEGSQDWQTTLAIRFSTPFADQPGAKVNKVAFINGKPFKSSTQYLSQRFGSFELGFHTVVFNPSDHDLVRGEPAIRRSFLDRVIAAEDAGYLKLISKYQRVLQQRNSMLKNSESTGLSAMREMFLGFTEPLVSYGSQITLKRLEWLQKSQKLLNEIVHQIAPYQPELSIFYLSNWAPEIENLSILNKDLGPVYFAGHGALPSIELLEQVFWKKLSLLESAEWRSGHSLVGPHRDDWSFYLGGQVLKGHGSQGEIRSALLALKLSEIQLFRDATGHRPLFLLDDFSSELDRERRSFLLKFLTDTDLQVFVTTTEDVFLSGKRVWIKNGKLQESERETNPEAP